MDHGRQDLMHVLKDYGTKEHAEIIAGLLGKSKDNLIAMRLDLYHYVRYNDLNSSTMRV